MMNLGPTGHHFYGRRVGHSLSPAQKNRLAQNLPHFGIEKDHLSSSNWLQQAFQDLSKPLWLEIGFGKGEHLALQAEHNPSVNLIGCEPFINGVSSLVDFITERNLKNIRVYPDDARDVLDALPDASVDKVFLLHPDPWPKRRHAKRRFVSQKNLQSIARIIKDGGILRIGADHPIYTDWTMLEMDKQSWFSWSANCAQDWKVPPTDWFETRYQQKAMDGQPVYLEFIRQNR